MSLDPDLMARKLESLRRCLERITHKRPESAAVLENDVDIQDILSVNLERAIQLCVDMANHILADQSGPPAETMGETFDLLAKQKIISAELASQMKAAVGFRNLSVHAYDRIDWERVFKVVHDHLDNFRNFARSVAQRANLEN